MLPSKIAVILNTGGRVTQKLSRKYNQKCSELVEMAAKYLAWASIQGGWGISPHFLGGGMIFLYRKFKLGNLWYFDNNNVRKADLCS